jgi:hypothetical protein
MLPRRLGRLDVLVRHALPPPSVSGIGAGSAVDPASAAGGAATALSPDDGCGALAATGSAGAPASDVSNATDDGEADSAGVSDADAAFGSHLVASFRSSPSCDR